MDKPEMVWAIKCINTKKILPGRYASLEEALEASLSRNDLPDFMEFIQVKAE